MLNHKHTAKKRVPNWNIASTEQVFKKIPQRKIITEGGYVTVQNIFDLEERHY